MCKNVYSHFLYTYKHYLYIATFRKKATPKARLTFGVAVMLHLCIL